jgi:hypothetical protein
LTVRRRAGRTAAVRSSTLATALDDLAERRKPAERGQLGRVQLGLGDHLAVGGDHRDRNFPALSLVRVNFAGTYASCCLIPALCRDAATRDHVPCRCRVHRRV